jgi:hypothetical protein
MLPPGPPDMGFGGSGPARYKVMIYPIPEDLEVIRNLQKEGVKNLEKRDEDGSYFTFSRATAIIASGKTIGMDPPTILDKDGKPFYERIGKGSDITVKLEVYKHRVPGNPNGAKAARLLTVMVDNLVPFQNEIDLTERQQKAIQGLIEQPKPNYNF